MAFLLLAALALATAPAVVLGDPLEPPPESAEGSDYALDTADSLAAGEVELGIGVESAGGEVERRRRVRFQDSETSGSVREGSGDPLKGGVVESQGKRHGWVVGKLAPRWGRGLLLGAPADPWQGVALDRGPRAAFRGRSGEGAAVRAGPDRDPAFEALAGRFSGRDLAGMTVRRGRFRVAALGGRHTSSQASAGWSAPAVQTEVALDPRGRWRAEALVHRPLGSWTATAVTRAGAPSFRSAAEPRRSGPARAVILGAEGSVPGGEARAVAACWRFRAGEAGVRLALAARHPLAEGAELAWGLEEQHGTRRQGLEASGMRQGVWIEWTGPDDPLRLSLRHESWGARGGVREVVRAVSGAGVEARGPFRVRLRVEHAVFRARRGERLYLLDSESDRLVLRAVAGEGQRTRIDLLVPAGRARLRAGLQLAATSGRPARPRWSVEWTRRTRPGGARGAAKE